VESKRIEQRRLSVRRVVVVEYVSLDGVIQAPGHPGEDSEGGFDHGGWTGPFMDDHRRYLSEQFQAAGAVVLGRVTYQIFAAYWPTVTDEDDEIARALNSLPKYVASTTLDEAQWDGTTVIKSDVAEEVARLKEQPGRDILVVGSSGLAQSLMQHDLVDEYRLWVHPIVLGSGKRLFREGVPATTLRLVDTRTTSSGLVILTYQSAAKKNGNAA
jgi:dihydrofolate reductase